MFLDQRVNAFNEVDDCITARILLWQVNASYNRKETRGNLLLTLFTTLGTTSVNDGITQILLDNWSTLGENVQPYMFYLPGQDHVVNLAVSRGWKAIPVPKMNKYSVPYLRNMYQAVTAVSDSEFYGYANSDIIFDSGLAGTLKVLRKKLTMYDPVLVIGRRTSLNFSIYENLTVSHFKDVRKVAESGILDRADAEDYFLVTRSFPWKLLPDLVIGRKGYDNFLVAKSIENNVSVIDATDTITSLHLKRTPNINMRKIGDHLFNKYKLVNKFDYMKAMTISAPYYTRTNENGLIEIKKRHYDRRFENVKWNRTT
jgi:hypothetical protein